MPYNAPDEFVKVSWTPENSKSYRERTEGKYEKNRGRNSEWNDDVSEEEVGAGAGTGAGWGSVRGQEGLSRTPSDRSAWHPGNGPRPSFQDGLVKGSEHKSEGGAGDEGDSTYGADGTDTGREGEEVSVVVTESRSTKTQSLSRGSAAGEGQKEMQAETVRDKERDREGERDRERERPKVSKVSGTKKSVEKMSDAKNEYDKRSRDTAESAEGDAFTRASALLSTSTINRVVSCETFFLSVYFYVPSLRSFLLKSKEGGQKIEPQKKKKKSPVKSRISETDFIFYGKGHQILWKILEKMENEIIDRSSSAIIFDADSFSEEVRDFMVAPEKHFEGYKVDNIEISSPSEHSYLPFLASSVVEGKNVLGKSKISIEFAIQDCQQIMEEYIARKEQLELLSAFRVNETPVKITENIQTPAPVKITENIQNSDIEIKSTVTELKAVPVPVPVPEERKMLSEDDFNLQNIEFDCVEDEVLERELFSPHTHSTAAVLQEVSTVGAVSATSTSTSTSSVGELRSAESAAETMKEAEAEEGERVIEIEGSVEIDHSISPSTPPSPLPSLPPSLYDREYCERLEMIEQRASVLSSQRAQRSFSLWESYETEVRRRRLDGISEELDAKKRAIADDSGGDGEEEEEDEDGISIQNAEMLYYLQSDDNDESIRDEDRERREEEEEEEGSGTFNPHSNPIANSAYQSIINMKNTNIITSSREGADEGQSVTRSKYSFSFSDEDLDAVLKEGEYVDDREQEQVIQSEARRASGKYR